MILLTPDECRVLGVLIEKELTTPEQYPLSPNALVNGSNQKNNRFPIVNFDEDRVLDAVEGLQAKGLAVRVDQAGARVSKYKHQTTEKLGINRYQLVILAELLLRGPQTLGELRSHASRMHNLETIEVVKEMLTALAGRPEPLAREIPPSPGSRAERYIQLLCPDAHPIDASSAAAAWQPTDLPSNRSMQDRIESLERQSTLLRDAMRKMAASLGEPDPLSNWDSTGGDGRTE